MVDGTTRLLQSSLSVQRGRDAARALGQPMVASASCQVHNADRLLSPEFGGSPVYQLVLPGRGYRVRMQAGTSFPYDLAIRYDSNDLYDGVETLPVFNGLLEEPQFDSGLGIHETTLAAIGSLSKLSGGKAISSPLYQNIRTDQALNILLDLAGWPSDERVIAIGDTTIDLWWLDNVEPLNAAIELLATEGAPAALYEDTLGYLVFENRLYRANTPRSQTARYLFSDHQSQPIGYDDQIAYESVIGYDAGNELGYTHIQPYAPSFADVRNHASYDITRRLQQTLQKVWEYGGPLTLAGSESRLISLSVSDPCTGAVTPVNGTDYTVAVGSLASPPTIEIANAQKIGIRFIAGSSGATVNGVTSNGPQLRAQPWTQVSTETIENSVDASSSIAATKGVRTMTVNGRREVSQPYAQAVCNANVNYYQINRPVIAMLLENADGAHLLTQLLVQVSDRISVISYQLGMLSGAEFYVEQIEHRRADMKLTTVLTCERVAPAFGAGLWDQGTWDVALWGE